MSARTRIFLDEVIDRRAVPALKTHPMVLGPGGDHLFAAGVADMDFKASPVVLEAMRERLEHGVFGYEAVPDGLFPALTKWLETRHGWSVDKAHILRAPNVLNILAIAASLFSDEGDGIIVQPPVFFDFYDVLRENHREIVVNPLILQNGRYAMDFDGLEELAAIGIRNQQLAVNGMMPEETGGDPLAVALLQRDRDALAEMPPEVEHYRARNSRCERKISSASTR